MAAGAAMVINTDAHVPGDLIVRGKAEEVLLAAGIPRESIDTVFANSQTLIDRITEE